MKTAHVKTVDGTTTMIQFESVAESNEFVRFLANESLQVYAWDDGPKKEFCVIFKAHIISVRFREVE